MCFCYLLITLYMLLLISLFNKHAVGFVMQVHNVSFYVLLLSVLASNLFYFLFPFSDFDNFCFLMFWTFFCSSIFLYNIYNIPPRPGRFFPLMNIKLWGIRFRWHYGIQSTKRQGDIKIKLDLTKTGYLYYRVVPRWCQECALRGYYVTP